MISAPRLFIAVCAVLLAFAVAPVTRAAEFTPVQRSAVERIVHDYLVAHPEVLQEAMAELEKRQTAAAAAQHKAAVKAHAKQLFDSPDQVTLGNPKGNVTFVEFFDYNCAYCKRAMGDMLTLMKTDPNLKVVLKEFPVLGPGSVEAAKVAVAVRMQAPREISRIPPEAPRRPRPCRRGARLGGGQGDRPRHGPAAEGHEVRRGGEVAEAGLQPCRGARSQRHAELCDRRQCDRRRRRLRSLKEQINTARCGKASC